MFSLFYGLWKYIFTKTQFQILILGIDKAGKTTLLERIKGLYSEFEGLPLDRIVPTVGLNIGRAEAFECKLIFWDLGGQRDEIMCDFGVNQNKEGFTIYTHMKAEGLMQSPSKLQHSIIVGLRTIWEKYFEEAHAVIYVVDAASRSRFEDTKTALEKVLRNKELSSAPILILANKQDLPDAVSAMELSRYLDLKELDERPHLFQDISAYDGNGIRDGISWLVDSMKKSKRLDVLRHHANAAIAV